MAHDYTSALLDLAPGVGQVQLSWEFELLDRHLNEIGRVSPLTVGSITAQSTGDILRKFQGVSFRASDVAAMNLYSDRIRPWVTLPDGSRYPCGVFMFTDEAITQVYSEPEHAVTLFDQGFMLAQSLDRSFGLRPGGSILQAAFDVLSDIAIRPRSTPMSDQTAVGDPPNWPMGTPRSKILGELADLAGWLPPHFDNWGEFVITNPPDINASHPHHRYTPATALNIVRHNNLLDAPNTIIVIGTGPGSGEVSAVAYVRSDLPYSVENRGFKIVKKFEVQGLSSTEHAQHVANTFAQRVPGLTSITFDSVVPDPRHDLFQLVDWDGTIFRQTNWDLKLPFGPHSHAITLGGFDNA